MSDYLEPGAKILWFEGEDDENNIGVVVVSHDENGLIIRDEHGKVFDGSHGGYMPPVLTIKLSRMSDLFGS